MLLEVLVSKQYDMDMDVNTLHFFTFSSSNWTIGPVYLLKYFHI